GTERRNMIMSDEDKRITAYHEAGHALICMLTPEDSDPVHKVTIIPRGMALGVTQTLPVQDRYNLTKTQIHARIRHAMGGRAAEELVFGHFSTGASNDLDQATSWGRRMVCEYGMSDRLGPVTYGESSGDVFLGRDMMQRKDYSEKKAEEIDAEVADLLQGKYDEAMKFLVDNRDVLDRIATALLERETLETDELDLLLKNEELPPLEKVIHDPVQKDADSKPESESSGGFSGDGVPDPEPMPS
ncbi:MAG: cell division protein FtsH, partial [bacterium]|nr:cell division protein FtsH [bacterium]